MLNNGKFSIFSGSSNPKGFWHQQKFLMPYVSGPRGTTSRSLGWFRRTFWYPPPPPPHDSLCDSRSMYRHLRRPVGEGRRRWEKWTFFQFFSLPTSFWVFRLPTSFRIPPADLLPIFVFLLTSFWDFRLPTTFRDFRLPTTFSGPPGGFKKKIEKNRLSLRSFSIYPPTDDFSEFPPTDDLQGTSRRLFWKKTKK